MATAVSWSGGAVSPCRVPALSCPERADQLHGHSGRLASGGLPVAHHLAFLTLRLYAPWVHPTFPLGPPLVGGLPFSAALSDVSSRYTVGGLSCCFLPPSGRLATGGLSLVRRPPRGEREALTLNQPSPCPAPGPAAIRVRSQLTCCDRTLK